VGDARKFVQQAAGCRGRIDVKQCSAGETEALCLMPHLMPHWLPASSSTALICRASSRVGAITSATGLRPAEGAGQGKAGQEEGRGRMGGGVTGTTGHGLAGVLLGRWEGRVASRHQAGLQHQTAAMPTGTHTSSARIIGSRASAASPPPVMLCP
jgi:hypothetical protein